MLSFIKLAPLAPLALWHSFGEMYLDVLPYLHISSGLAPSAGGDWKRQRGTGSRFNRYRRSVCTVPHGRWCLSPLEPHPQSAEVPPLSRSPVQIHTP